MTVKEKLLQEFECAINAIYGDVADMDTEEVEITRSDLEAIKRKVLFYMDLD